MQTSKFIADFPFYAPAAKTRNSGEWLAFVCCGATSGTYFGLSPGEIWWMQDRNVVGIKAHSCHKNDFIKVLQTGSRYSTHADFSINHPSTPPRLTNKQTPPLVLSFVAVVRVAVWYRTESPPRRDFLSLSFYPTLINSQSNPTGGKTLKGRTAAANVQLYRTSNDNELCYKWWVINPSMQWCILNGGGGWMNGWMFSK